MYTLYMNDERLKTVVKEIEKIALGLTAMKASGGYKTRKQIHLSDVELKDYMERISTEIYGAFASNLILQEMFSEKLQEKDVLKKYNNAVDTLLKQLIKSNIFRG